MTPAVYVHVRTLVGEWWETSWTWGPGLVQGNAAESRHESLALARGWLAKLRSSRKAKPGSTRLVHVRRYGVSP